MQMLKSTITTMLPALFQSNSESSHDISRESLAATLPAALPDERDYSNDVHIATVHSASALFLHLLDDLKQSCSSESVAETLSLLQPATVCLLSACPVSCYNLLVTYLRSSVDFVATRTTVLRFTDVCVESRRFFSLLPDVIVEPVRAVACHPNIAKLEEMADSLQPMSG